MASEAHSALGCCLLLVSLPTPVCIPRAMLQQQALLRSFLDPQKAHEDLVWAPSED